MPPAQSSSQAPTNLTPVSTPQGVSPDPATATAATPSEAIQDAANDPDAHLVDTTDEAWSVVLSHKLSNSNSLTDWQPCLASGFLIKRGGDPSSDRNSTIECPPATPTAIGINILWLGSTPRGSGPSSSQPPSQTQTPTSSQSAVPPSSSASFAQAAAQNQTSNAQQAAAAMTAHMRSGGPAFDQILRDYISVYRSLGTLAHLRGMRGTKGGAIPWHIAAAMNAVDALEKCM